MKKAIYYILAVLFPFILLAGIEGVLRLVGYGVDTRLFVTDSSYPDYWSMNRDVSKKYFPVAGHATIGNQEPFRKKKSPRTIRLFVLGASSSLGFPYMHNGTFSRMLKYKLQFEYPDYRFEIINLSLTAINTYTLYDFAKQVVDYSPDGILIYAGHNEYYGALGVASSNYVSSSPLLTDWYVKLKQFRLVQALSAVIHAGSSNDSVNLDRTLMEQMAERHIVPYRSEIYEKGIRQFETNMKQILQLFQSEHIPVFIGTLASNLKDQSPLEKQNVTSVELFNQASRNYVERNFQEAHRQFAMAKAYDGIRFRAPDEFNEYIRRCARMMDNVYLVDVTKCFEEYSPHGIVGKELLLEHVHPNLYGHRRIAEAFYEEIQRHLLSGKKREGGRVVDLQDYPTTAFDTICGELVIWQLKQQWPFNESPSEVVCDTTSFEFKTALRFLRKQLNWGEAMQKLNNHYILEKDYQNALRIVEQMCLELPCEKMFMKQAGSLSLYLQQKEKADFYFKQLRNDE